MFVQTVAVSLLALLLGLALCFAGFRFFVLLLPLWAFFAGFLVTAQAIQQIFGGGFLATTSGWVFGFVIGVGCALLAYFYYYAAVVVLAASAGYEFGVGILSGFGVGAGFALFVVGLIIAAFVATAVIYFNLPKILIIVLTAEVGASLILTGVLLALGPITLSTLTLGTVGAFIHRSWLWFVVFIVLMVVGIFAQLRLPGLSEEYTAAAPQAQV